MSKRTLFAAALTLFIGGAILGSPVLAQGIDTVPWWNELYEVTDPTLATRLEAHANWISADRVNCNATTCAVELDRMTTIPGGDPICADVEVFALPQSRGYGGVFVGDDLFLTVHAFGQNTCLNRKVIFGYGADSAASPLLDPLDPGETLDFVAPLSDVYDCVEILEGGTTTQWTLIRLDRPVTGRRPVKLQRFGFPEPGTPVTNAGYPARLPLKIEAATLNASTSSGGTSNAHVLGGSSGSMVLAPSGRTLGVVATGNTGWWIEDPIAGCFRPDPDRNSTGTFDRPVDDDLDLIPAFGLEVTHDAESGNGLVIDHHGPYGGPFTNEVVTYRAEAGVGGTAVDWSLVHYDIIEIIEIPNPPTDFHLEPGEFVEFEARADLAASFLPVGLYEDLVALNDLTFSTLDTVTHRVHVGVDGFDLDCAYDPPRCELDFLGEGPSGALVGETASYQLTNRWNIDHTIEVEAPAWISVGSSGAGFGSSSSEVTIPAGGSVVVTLTVVDDGSSGTFESTVAFVSTDAGAENSRHEILARADLARIVIDGEPNLVIVPGASEELVLFANRQPGKVDDVDMCIFLQGSITPGGPTGGDPPMFTLRGPGGASVPLGRRAGKICWSDEIFSPPSPKQVTIETPGLTAFEGGSFGGTWTLVIEADAKVEWDEFTLVSTSLRLRKM